MNPEPPETPEPTAPDDPARAGAAARLAGRGREAGRAVAGRLDELRARFESVDVVFDAVERDRRLAGSVLAGGLAYRLFFCLIPYALVVVGLLGFFSAADPQDLERNARSFGLSTAATSVVAAAARDAESGRVWLVVLGTALFLWFGVGVARSLTIVSALAWGERSRRLAKPVHASLAVIGLLLLLIALALAAQRARAASPGPGVTVTILASAAAAAVLIAGARHLPHRGGWRGLLPGAVLFGLGLQALHFVTAYVLAPRICRQTELYGALGTSVVLLLWLYLLARLVTFGAFFNAAWWERRGASEPVR